MCIGGSNNHITAEDYYEGYQAEDGTYVKGMKKDYELPTLSVKMSEDREQALRDVAKPQGLMRGTGQAGKKRRTFFQQ